MSDRQGECLAVGALFAAADGMEALATGKPDVAAKYFERARRCGDACHVLLHGAEATLATVVRVSAERAHMLAILRDLVRLDAELALGDAGPRKMTHVEDEWYAAMKRAREAAK